MTGSLEVAVDDIDQFLLGVTRRVTFRRKGVDEVGSNAVFQNDREQSGHGATAARHLLQHADASLLF